MLCRLLRKVCLKCTKWWWLSKYKLQYAAWSSTLVRIKYFIHQMAKIFISIIWHAKKYNFSKFLSSWNTRIGMPPIPGFEIGKNGWNPGILYPGIAIPTCQLHVIFPLLLCEVYCWVNVRWNINHKIMPIMLFRWFLLLQHSQDYLFGKMQELRMQVTSEQDVSNYWAYWAIFFVSDSMFLLFSNIQQTLWRQQIHAFEIIACE